MIIMKLVPYNELAASSHWFAFCAKLRDAVVKYHKLPPILMTRMRSQEDGTAGIKSASGSIFLKIRPKGSEKSLSGSNSRQLTVEFCNGAKEQDRSGRSIVNKIKEGPVNRQFHRLGLDRHAGDTHQYRGRGGGFGTGFIHFDK